MDTTSMTESNLLFNTWKKLELCLPHLVNLESVSFNRLFTRAWFAPMSSRKSPSWISYNFVTLTTIHSNNIPIQHVAKYFIYSCWKKSLPLSTCLPHPIQKYKYAWLLDHHVQLVSVFLGDMLLESRSHKHKCETSWYWPCELLPFTVTPYLVRFINLHNNSSEWNFPLAG